MLADVVDEVANILLIAFFQRRNDSDCFFVGTRCEIPDQHGLELRDLDLVLSDVPSY